MALRILLADDSMTAQNMGKKILTDAGFDVVTVSNGAAAVKKLAESSPDIAILDVYMPGYTGLEVCERLKSSPATARVPVLLSVGKMEPFRPEDGMKVKADGVIIKPFEATDLVTVVDKLAERSYGPDAKRTGVVPDDAAEANEEEEDAADILEEPAPVRDTAAEGLQTFTPIADSGQAVAPEPDVEFTSAPKAGAVLDEPLDDLMPTVLQPQAIIDEPSTVVVEDAQEQPEPAARAVAAGAETAAEVPLEEVLLAVPDQFADIQETESVPETAQEPMGESATPTVAEPASAEAEAANDVNWTAVEAEVADQDVEIDLDLEAEMQAIAEEQATHEVPTAEPQHTDTAVPFLAPLGKTSFDELDAIMEQTAATEQTATPMSADEIQVPALTVEEAPEPETVLLSDEAMSDEAMIDSLASDELLSPLDTEAESTAIATTVQVGDAVPEESVLAAENMTVETEAAPVQESMADSDEVLDIAPEEDPQSPLAADAAAEQQDKLSALSYYGLADDEHEDILRNPVEETDEPLFAVADDPLSNDPPSDDPLPAEAIHADAPVANVAEEPLIAEETVAAEAPIADTPDVLEDVAADSVPEDVAGPVLEDVADFGSADAVVSDSEPSAPAPMEEIVTPVAIPAAAVAAEQPVQVVAAAAPAPAVDDAMVTVMVERVVDRVVDRLKPILVVMVEEILVELKSRS